MGKYKGFSQVQLTKPQKSTFDLSHDRRISTRMGRLTPILCEEALPGDMFNGSSELLVRLAPLLAPIYDQIECYVHYYFIPNRHLWVDWEKFITGGRIPGTDPVTPPIPPRVDIGAALTAVPTEFGASKLSDYLGLGILPQSPSLAADYNTKHISTLPFLAYQKVWFDYYRDRNFTPDTDLDGILPAPSGTLTPIAWFNTYISPLRTRMYKHDYYTSALPFVQRGAQVLIPIDGTVTYLAQSLIKNTSDGLLTTPAGYLGHVTDGLSTAGQLNYQLSATVPPTVSGTDVRIENIDKVSNSTSTIQDFRAAYALQVWMERNAVAGSRYTESIQAHFAVRPQDFRLQRAEYIGGGRIPVKISEVVSNAYSNDGAGTVPLGNMGGHGVTYGTSNRFRYFCPEHGFIMGILSIMNPPSYHQGIPRMFRRTTFLDYPWPTFANLGEQEVLKYELYSDHLNLTPDANGKFPIFGYQSRYAEWKWRQNSSHGIFHTTLNFWTLTRNFLTSPVLGNLFNTFEDLSQNRIFAVNGTSDNFWIYVFNKVFVKRSLPYYGTPNTLGF